MRNLQGRPDHPSQLLQVERLEQVVVRPVTHRLDGSIGRTGQCDKHNREAGVDRADLLEDLQPGLVGQTQVKQNNVRRSGRDALQALGACAGDLDTVSGSREQVANLLLEHFRVVIDKQQMGHVGRVLGTSGRCDSGKADVLASAWKGDLRMNDYNQDFAPAIWHSIRTHRDEHTKENP